MAAQTAVVSSVGVKDSLGRLRTIKGVFAGAWADADTMEITIPSYVAAGWYVVGVKVFTYGAGAVGARVATFLTPAQIPLTSINEATGTIVMTNSSGGPITGANFQLIIAKD